MSISRVGLSCALLSMIFLIPATAQAQEQPTDANITYLVQHAVRSDPRVPADRITVLTENGIVILAGNVAWNTRGVWRVENRFSVGDYEQLLAQLYFSRP